MMSFKTYLVKATSGLIPGLMPPIHIYILYKFWGKYSRKVDKRYCSCSCWDTVFKGTYESGIASYKHMYFNATSNTVKIWLITVASFILLYECLKYELKLLLQNHLRPLMAILFISSIFSHYYTWWVYVNYWNDDFYSQWNHQLFFTFTEIISTSLVLHLSNSKIPVTYKKVLIIISIAIVHILSGSLDQFVRNIFWGEGYAHQVLRDLAFLVPDILHVILPIIEFLRNNQLPAHNLINNLIYIIGLILFGFLFQVSKSVNSLTPEICLGHAEPQVQYLNYQISVKSARLQLSKEKTSEIKEAISSIKIKSEEIQRKYNGLLKQLKNDLTKTESEYESLHSQIRSLNEKKNKILKELQ